MKRARGTTVPEKPRGLLKPTLERWKCAKCNSDLVDMVGGGSGCPNCEFLEVVDVVRALHRRVL